MGDLPCMGRDDQAMNHDQTIIHFREVKKVISRAGA